MLQNLDPVRVAYLMALLSVFAILIACAWRGRQARDSTKATTSDIGKAPELGADVAKADSTAVPDAAIATNFQLLSVFPNVAFGLQGLLAIPLLNILGFLLGNAATYRWFERFLSAVANHRSPHQFIAAQHGAPSLRKWTAIISLLVFVAVTCFELVYLSRISRALLGDQDSSYFVLVGLLTMTMMFISATGQQRGQLLADRWLLLVAYIGLHAAIAYFAGITTTPLDLTSICAAVWLGAMLWIRWRNALGRPGGARWRHIVIMLSTVVLLGPLLYFRVAKTDWSQASLQSAFQQFTPAAGGMTASVFALAALASVLPALLYNFVDFSIWQKYLSEVGQGGDVPSVARRLRRPFLLCVIESPLSWLLPVLLGVLAAGVLANAQASNNPITDLINLMSARGGLATGLAVLFYGALVAIAASTACGYLASLSYLVRIDLMPSPMEDRAPEIPIVIVGLLMLLILLPIDMLFKSTDTLILLMLTSFAPLCALTPLVVWPLLCTDGQTLSLSRLGILGVSVALTAGSLLGVGVGLYGALTQASPVTAVFWGPMPVAFIVSWVLYLCSVGFGRARK